MFRAPVDWRIFRDGDELRDRLWRAQRLAYHLAVGAKIRAELYPEPEPPARPAVLMAARVAIGEQVADGATALAKAAAAGGWATKTTYALATSKAKMVETCVCRYRLGRLAGWAAWERVGGGSWSFGSAWLCGYRFGWQRGKGSDKPTIREMLAMLGKPVQD